MKVGKILVCDWLRESKIGYYVENRVPLINCNRQLEDSWVLAVLYLDLEFDF
jgi:hypothetical protein